MTDVTLCSIDTRPTNCSREAYKLNPPVKQAEGKETNCHFELVCRRQDTTTTTYSRPAKCTKCLCNDCR
jgi:hypothetical protein